MTETDDAAELLFFDTFSHEVDADINLDLVQFPKPVYITQVRIIPLGARVQADFPGGVRLGATNPSKFDIEFFVNDLGMPGASTFENLGHLEYNQNDCIHLECTQEKIPTDGLVLRGWYSTITLAVYGILTNTMTEQIASPPPPCEPATSEELCSTASSANAGTTIQEDNLKEEWKEPLPGEPPHAHKTSVSDFERDELEYGISRESYHQTDEERDRRLRKASHSSDRSERNRTHSESNERDFLRSRNERDRDRGEKPAREWSRSPDYSRRSRRKRSERSRSDVEDAQHKWPRTPPASIDSPIRPHSPDGIVDFDNDDGPSTHYKIKSRTYMRSNESLGLVANVATAQDATNIVDDDETPGTPGEQFEPILSDDEIIGDDDSNTAEQTAADEFEMEIETAAGLAEPAITDFNSFKMNLKKFEGDTSVNHTNESENLVLLLKKFELQTKCGSLGDFKSNSTTVDERENFVYLSEQLINQLTFLSQNYKRRNLVMMQFFKDVKNLNQAYNILHLALDFDAACLQQQPAFKIRHIKIGARLTELLGSCSQFIKYILNEQNFQPFAVLFELYCQEFMAMSIKLMILKAIYALLDTKAGMQNFTSAQINGYQWILQNIKQTQLTRTKYALKSIVKKINLYEALESIRENCTKLFVLSNLHAGEECYKLVEHAIEHVLDALNGSALSYQQPRRFLPVSKKFEIVSDNGAQRCFANSLQNYFRIHSLGESMLLLLSNANELPLSLLAVALDLLQRLLQSNIGVDYFVDNCFESTQLLVLVLLGIEKLPSTEDESVAKEIAVEEVKPLKSEIKIEESRENELPKSTETNVVEDSTTKLPVKVEPTAKTEEIEKTPKKTSPPPPNELDPASTQFLSRLQKLGFEIAFKVQTRYHLDAILYIATSTEYNSISLATHLHELYSQTCTTTGRKYTIELIGLNNNLQILMDLIKKEQRIIAQRQLTSPSTKYKSPVLSYAVDMLDCCVRFCENLEYLIEHGVKILELAKNHETFEPSVSAVLQEMFVYLKPLETINIFAYDDISPLLEVISRSLEYITTFPGDLIMGLRILRHLAIGPTSKSVKSADTEELKHRFVALQFYAADGVQTLIHILEKLCSYFDQPGLHTPALVTIQGIHCCQIILPTLQILREMLSFAIQCRDVDFKDLTAIDHLMKTYFLMHYFPVGSQAADDAEQAKKEIVQILLAYTQPNEQDEEFLHKSLWTQMIREVLKNIVNGPSTYIPGLQVFAELLPLPLPLPTAIQLQEAQTQRLITERKLWSAHLHPQSSQLAKLIETIAPTSFPQLADLLTRVCLQLADLAPNMTLLISKTLTDQLCAEWTNASSTATIHLSRLLNFFAQLTPYPSIKSSALSILSGKLWDLFHSILTATDPNEICMKCQIAIHRILECFLDSEISFISPMCTSSADVNLASALPPKELIPLIVEAVITNLFSVKLTDEVAAVSARNLVILTEHDITFYHLMQSLKQKRNEFKVWLQKLIEVIQTGDYNPLIETLVLLLRSLIQIEENSTFDPSIPNRTLKLTSLELAQLIGFQKDTKEPNILQRLLVSLEKHKDGIASTLFTDIDNLSSMLQSIETSTSMELDEDSVTSLTEPAHPQTESIVTQYAARPIFTIYDSSADEAQLYSKFWLEPLRFDAMSKDDFEQQCERIACDLTELANSCLSVDTNLSSDCKRVLHLSALPQSNRERTPTAPCFRTRRVEVEPSTGRPEKKIYITPVRGRGFSRAPPSRGDLFRSRPPNTSRPPSLHVDDFLALETCGAQPTGPTGYNKIPPLMRGSRVGRNRGSRISLASTYRKPKVLRTSSPSTWNDSASQHYRSVTSESISSHFGSDSHYSSGPHFGGRPRGRGGRARSYLR